MKTNYINKTHPKSEVWTVVKHNYVPAGQVPQAGYTMFGPPGLPGGYDSDDDYVVLDRPDDDLLDAYIGEVSDHIRKSP